MDDSKINWYQSTKSGSALISRVIREIILQNCIPHKELCEINWEQNFENQARFNFKMQKPVKIYIENYVAMQSQNTSTPEIIQFTEEYKQKLKVINEKLHFIDNFIIRAENEGKEKSEQFSLEFHLCLVDTLGHLMSSKNKDSQLFQLFAIDTMIDIINNSRSESTFHFQHSILMMNLAIIMKECIDNLQYLKLVNHIILCRCDK